MRVLVTGGGGFLGKNIVKQLCDRGEDVTILARGRYPEVEALGASSVQCDLSRPTGLASILEGIDVVFHTAAKAGVWGSRESFWSVNVEGTRNLLEASKKAGVKKFVFTSSPSAVWNGGDESNLTEEDCPYPEKYLKSFGPIFRYFSHSGAYFDIKILIFGLRALIFLKNFLKTTIV